MTIQTLLDAWKGSGAFLLIEAPATEAEIQGADEKIGAQLLCNKRFMLPTLWVVTSS